MFSRRSFLKYLGLGAVPAAPAVVTGPVRPEGWIELPDEAAVNRAIARAEELEGERDWTAKRLYSTVLPDPRYVNRKHSHGADDGAFAPLEAVAQHILRGGQPAAEYVIATLVARLLEDMPGKVVEKGEPFPRLPGLRTKPTRIVTPRAAVDLLELSGWGLANILGMAKGISTEMLRMLAVARQRWLDSESNPNRGVEPSFENIYRHRAETFVEIKAYMLETFSFCVVDGWMTPTLRSALRIEHQPCSPVSVKPESW